ncbi:hypothetical protein LTR12_004759 [Friedmanniomyces endolithicus]|nr:hypothetical protein LTR74_013013 [Friedmanniomyces endolithicus]KAK1820888.1 hypothetical protein LTR12_004759 [Friedmanniomyces endolithicus]
MQRAHSEQTTQLQYNRHLAAYYRQQIAALQQGLPRCPPFSTAAPAAEDDSIEIIVDDPLAAFEFPSQQETQHSISSSSMSTWSPNDDGDVVVTSRERTESYESERSVLAATPDSAGSSKPASPRTVSTAGVGTASSPVPKKGLKLKARSKSGRRGLGRFLGRRSGGDD